MTRQRCMEHRKIPTIMRNFWEKPWIVPIPGTRKYGRLIENAQAAEVHLTAKEVEDLDKMLETVPMSDVFGGSKIRNTK